MNAPSFDAYLQSLTPMSPSKVAAEPTALDLCQRATGALEALGPLTSENLAELIEDDPELVPVLAAAAGLSQERFKTWLQASFGTAGWIRLARSKPSEFVTALEEEFSLIALLTTQMARQWTWADVLARAMAPRQRASDSVTQGRALEDDVEAVLKQLGLNFQPRTRFEGTGERSAPADFAIPSGGSHALIAIAAKSFDSTGSKLTDARREIEEMATVRKPAQFIFAVIDGQGWIRRQSDLKTIHGLWSANFIEGLYTRTTLSDFAIALQDAAKRVKLI